MTLQNMRLPPINQHAKSRHLHEIAEGYSYELMCDMTTYFGKELFILFAASAFRKLSSIYVFSYFPFGFEGRIWDLIVSVPDHCLSFYLLYTRM